MTTIRFMGTAGLVVCIAALALPARAATWSRDFNDGSLQGLIEFDYGWLFGIEGFDPFVQDGALRLRYEVGDGNDIGLLYDTTPVMTDTSARMLVKWSSNPLYSSTPGTDVMRAGLFLRTDPNGFATLEFKAYIVLMDDEGQLSMAKLVGIQTPDICEQGEAQIEGFDPTKNWWLRCEATNLPGGQVRIRGRAWAEGTPEPDTWLIECLDFTDVYLAGVVAVGSQERNAADRSADQSYVDVDDIWVGPPPEVNCYNHLDDDDDGLVDCLDSDCAQAPACACAEPFADLDRDQDVDQSDFGLWQLCYTGAGGLMDDPARCDCLDRDDANADKLFDPSADGDGDVDLNDFAAFQVCLSGPGMKANAQCDDAAR